MGEDIKMLHLKFRKMFLLCGFFICLLFFSSSCDQEHIVEENNYSGICTITDIINERRTRIVGTIEYKGKILLITNAGNYRGHYYKEFSIKPGDKVMVYNIRIREYTRHDNNSNNKYYFRVSTYSFEEYALPRK